MWMPLNDGLGIEASITAMYGRRASPVAALPILARHRAGQAKTSCSHAIPRANRVA
jgi:hypothetical protein